MQFFPEPLKALREMRRVLADRGRAAISVCRPIEFCPAYATLADALGRFAGAEAAAMMRSPFSRWSVAELKALAVDAGFARVGVRIEVASLRYPSAGEFLRREAASSPLAPLVSKLDANVRAELVGELESALADHTDDEGVVCGFMSTSCCVTCRQPFRAAVAAVGVRPNRDVDPYVRATARIRCALPEKINAFSSAVSDACLTDSTVGTIDSVGPLSDPKRMRSAPNTFAANAIPRGPRPLWPVSR